MVMGLKLRSRAQAESPEKNVFSEDVREDEAVEQFGYQAELKRSFGLFGMIGFSFNIVASWLALTGVLIIGVQSGGPPVMIWSWVGISLVSLLVGYSMAEMTSAYPLAGGQYTWVAVLAPPKIARQMAYICGWFMLIGIIAMGATSNFITANFLLGMIKLANQDYMIQRWHTVLVCYLLIFVVLSINILIPHMFDRINRVMLIYNILAFVVCTIALLAASNNLKSARFVFSDFQNFTGFSDSFAAVIGLLNAGFGMCCYDAPAHLVEDLKDARRAAPRAIIMSILIGAVTGFVFLIALCFSVTDFDRVATTNTGVPFVQIAFDSTGSVAGACALTSVLFVLQVNIVSNLMAEGSRAVYAFARDQGLPFSGTLRKVSAKRHIPVAGMLLTAAVQMAMNAIYFGSYTGFLTVVSIATEGFYVSYALPLLARILGYISHHPAARNMGGLYSLGKWSLPFNAVGVLFLCTMCITFNFPTLAPVNSENMNYTCAAVGVIMVLAVITWLTTGMKHFTGPRQAIIAVEGSMQEDGSPSPSEKETVFVATKT